MSSRRRSLWLVHTLLIGLPTLLAVGGYLFALGHAHLRITLRDVANPGAAIAAGLPVTLRDTAGETVLRGLTTSYGVVALDYPDFGPCAADATTDEERWHACRFERARWLNDHVRRIATLTLDANACRLKDVPMSLAARREAALTWWLPIEGLGGPPFTDYQAEYMVDLRACRVLGGAGR